jgi:hypothetical protein
MRYRKNVIDALILRNNQPISQSSYALDDFEGTSILLSNLLISDHGNIITFIEAQEYLFPDFKEYKNMPTIVVSLIPKCN